MNRSAAPGPLVPTLVYEDVGKAIEWLCDTFGFTERFRYGPEDEPAGALLNVGQGGSVFLTMARTGQSPKWSDEAQLRPPRTTDVTHSVGVHVDDVDAYHERALQQGARVLNPPETHPFGERQFTVEDLAGHRWTFTQSVEDVAVSDWGGRPADLR